MKYNKSESDKKLYRRATQVARGLKWLCKRPGQIIFLSSYAGSSWIEIVEPWAAVSALCGRAMQLTCLEVKYIKLRETYTCPLELTHDMIKGKWKPIILWRLRLGSTSLSQLEKDINGITQKMLLEHLKELLEYGLVNKKVFEGYPLKVEYSLTEDRGIQILEALTIMQKLGIEFMLENGMEDILREKGVIN